MRLSPFIFRVSLFVIACGVAPHSDADVIEWDPLQGSPDVSKGFDRDSASFELDTESNAVTFELSHEGTTSNMDSASVWAVNRWPAPPAEIVNVNGVDQFVGDFNVVSNANNDVVLGLAGFYGEFGPSGVNTEAAEGDSTIYKLTLTFDVPVIGLDFQVIGINALAKENGFNSNDLFTIEAFLGRDAAASPTYSNEGAGFIRSGDELVGDWDNRIGTAPSDPNGFDLEGQAQHISDAGAVQLNFGEAVDSVALTLTSVAESIRPDENGNYPTDRPRQYSSGSNGLQTWAFSVGDLSFTTIPEPSSALLLGLGCLLTLRRRRVS